MAKRRATPKNREMTLTEFRAWLEGVEEMQAANWVPDQAQWKLIRSRIDNIILEEVEVQVAAPAPQPVRPGHSMPATFADQGVNNPPPAAAQQPTFVPPQSAVPVEPEITPAAAAALKGKMPAAGTSNAANMQGADGKLHTPNIDTSNGEYTSSFD